MDNYYQNCDLSMKSSDEKIFTENEISSIKDRICKEMADILGHSVETNERFYSHMKTESLVNLKDILNRTGSTDDAQKEFTHTYSHTKIVNFGQIKNSEKPINTRHFGI